MFIILSLGRFQYSILVRIVLYKSYADRLYFEERDVMMKTFLTNLAALAFVTSAATADDDVILDELEIADNLILFRPDVPIGNPSTLAFVGQEQILLIDVNLDNVIPLIVGRISELSEGPVTYVVTSHHHGDHTQGLESLPRSIVAIVPHQQRERLKTSPLTFEESPPLKTSALPALTFSEHLTLHIDDEVIDVFTPPNKASHTDGDAFVYFNKRKILYVGDHYVADKLPLIDLEGGGSVKGYMANLNWITENFSDDTIIVGGHGTFHPKAIRVDSLAKYSAWIKRIERAVSVLESYAAEGLTLGQAIERGLGEEFSDFDVRPHYASGERWTTLLYAHIQRQASAPQ